MRVNIKKKKTVLLGVLIILLINICAYSQAVTLDSIKELSFNDIMDSYYYASEKLRDKEKSLYYAKLYLEKAKIYKRNEIEHVYGHHFMSIESNKKDSYKHLDTILIISKNLADKSVYPSAAYLLKGNLYYSERDFDNALSNYLLALENSKVAKNNYIQTTAKTNIAIIKLERTGNEREALDIFKSCLQFYKTDEDKQFYHVEYLHLLHNFSEGYRRLNQLDSSRFYNLKGIIESKKIKDKEPESYFIFSEGINQVLRKNYLAGIDSLHKSSIIIDKTTDHLNKIISNYYLGKAYKELGQLDKTDFYFTKMDSIYQKHRVYSREMKKMYQYKMEEAKENGNLKKELLYVTSILQLDSLKYQNFASLSKTLKEKYDNQHLLEQQDKLENQLIKTHNNSKLKTYLLYLSILLVLVTFGFYYRKKQKFKVLFKKVMAQEKVASTITAEKSSKKLKLPEASVNKIVEGLLHFEEDNIFLKPQLTINEVAKIIGTNSKYLASILKNYKDKTFPNYLNDLRIAYTIDKLKKEPKFRNYTMSAISKEVGFTNVVSFRKAFYRYTNLQPFQFIKELKKAKIP